MSAAAFRCASLLRDPTVYCNVPRITVPHPRKPPGELVGIHRPQRHHHAPTIQTSIKPRRCTAPCASVPLPADSARSERQTKKRAAPETRRRRCRVSRAVTASPPRTRLLQGVACRRIPLRVGAATCCRGVLRQRGSYWPPASDASPCASTRRTVGGPRRALCHLVVDGSAERAGTSARRLIQGAFQRETAGCVGEASRSAGDGVDLDDRERGGARPGRLSGDRGEQGVAVCRGKVAAPVELRVGMLITIVTCSVYLPRCVAVPVPSRSKKRVGETTVPVSTALTVPLNGVSAATALAATIASDTVKAATSPTNSG